MCKGMTSTHANMKEDNFWGCEGIRSSIRRWDPLVTKQHAYAYAYGPISVPSLTISLLTMVDVLHSPAAIDNASDATGSIEILYSRFVRS